MPEEWSDEMKEAGDHKKQWFQRMKDQGLRVKVAMDDEGVVGGMIHYVPIEKVAVEGDDLYYMYCIWVHGYTGDEGISEEGDGKSIASRGRGRRQEPRGQRLRRLGPVPSLS